MPSLGSEEQSRRVGKTASFTVFVCSTFSDLSQEREGVLDAIRRLKLQHDSMEFFGARAEQPIETCQGKRCPRRDCRPPVRNHCSRAGNLILRSGVCGRVQTKETLHRLHTK